MEGGKLDGHFLAQTNMNFFTILTIWGSFSRGNWNFFPKISEEYTPLDSIGFSKSLGGDFHQFGYDYPSLSEDLLKFRRGIFSEMRSIFLSEKIDLASMLEIILYLFF